MRKFTGVLIACVAGLVLVATAIAGLNSSKSVHLSGDLEVPANASAGQGQASFHLSEDGTAVDYKLNVANIENVVVAHIHMGMPGANGPVGVFLYPSSTAGSSVPPGGGRIDGRIVDGTFTATNFIGPFAGKSVEEVWALIESGGAYVNVHTNDGVAPTNTGPGDLPGGEIRGDF
jgi:CHRD domain